jgi:hypothetical protein
VPGTELLFVTWDFINGCQNLRQGPDGRDPGPGGLTRPSFVTAQQLVASLTLRAHDLAKHETVLRAIIGIVSAMLMSTEPFGGVGRYGFRYFVDSSETERRFGVHQTSLEGIVQQSLESMAARESHKDRG